MHDESAILKSLQQQGCRLTVVRKSIIRALLKIKTPISTLELHEKLVKAKFDMNKTTVYREIESLKEAGVIRELQFGERMKRYEIIPEDHRHHLICKRCKTVEDVVMEDDLDEIEKRLKKQTKFMVQDHALAFYGLCVKCQ